MANLPQKLEMSSVFYNKWLSIPVAIFQKLVDTLHKREAVVLQQKGNPLLADF